jgi:hypothetical protein
MKPIELLLVRSLPEGYFGSETRALPPGRHPALDGRSRTRTVREAAEPHSTNNARLSDARRRRSRSTAKGPSLQASSSLQVAVWVKVDGAPASADSHRRCVLRNTDETPCRIGYGDRRRHLVRKGDSKGGGGVSEGLCHCVLSTRIEGDKDEGNRQRRGERGSRETDK